MPTVEPRKHPWILAIAHPSIPPSPLGDKVGYSNHDRFRGYIPFTFVSACNLPVYASQGPLPIHHARLGTRLPAKLYRGRYFRRLNPLRLQGATPTPPCVRFRTRRFMKHIEVSAVDSAVTRVQVDQRSS